MCNPILKSKRLSRDTKPLSWVPWGTAMRHDRRAEHTGGSYPEWLSAHRWYRNVSNAFLERWIGIKEKLKSDFNYLVSLMRGLTTQSSRSRRKTRVVLVSHFYSSFFTNSKALFTVCAIAIPLSVSFQ